MKHPLEFISPALRKGIFIALLIWTITLMVTFQFLDAPLKTQPARAGIVSFELANTEANAQAILNSWDNNARLLAAFGLGFDYLFMPSYAVTIALGILLAAGRHPGRYAGIGSWFSWGVFLAAICDTVENISLLVILKGPVFAPWPQIAASFAEVKFTLILAGIIYALTGGIWPKK